MSDWILEFEPYAIQTSAANILNPTITSLAGPVGFTPPPPFLIVEHMRIINTTASAIAVYLFKGATGADAAGSEFGWSAYSLPARGAGSINYDDWWGDERFDADDFLTGYASALGVTLNINGRLAWSS